MSGSTAEHEEDLIGGFVTHVQVHPDELEEGEVPFAGSIVSDGWKKKSTHANFLRRDRKRKQVAGFIALDVKEKETAKLLAAEKKKSNGLARIIKDTRWHVSLAQDGMRLMLFLIPLAVSSCLLLEL